MQRTVSFLVKEWTGGRKTVYERGLVSVLHPHLLMPEDPADNMHVLYAAEEIAARMAKVRLRHMKCTDRVEAMLLQGEFKYFSGKKIHFQNTRIDVLVSLLQNFAYFGFYSTPNLKVILTVAQSVLPEMTFAQIDKILHYLWVMGCNDEQFLLDSFDVLETRIASCPREDMLGILVSIERLNCEHSSLIDALLGRSIGSGELTEDALCSILSLGARLNIPFSAQQFKYLEQSALSSFNGLSALRQAKLLSLFVSMKHFQVKTHEVVILKWVHRILDYFNINFDEREVHDDTEQIDEYPEALSITLGTLARLHFFHPTVVIKTIDLLEDIITELDISSASQCLVFLCTLLESERMDVIRPLIHSNIEHILKIREKFGAIISNQSIRDIIDSLLMSPSVFSKKDTRITDIFREKIRSIHTLDIYSTKKMLQACKVHTWILSSEEHGVLLERLTELRGTESVHQLN